MESQINYLEEKYNNERAKRKSHEAQVEKLKTELEQWKLKAHNILQMSNSNRLMKMNKSLVEMNEQLLTKTKTVERANRACKLEIEALLSLVDSHNKLFGTSQIDV